MLERWLKHLLHSITDEGGYRIVIGVLAVFVGAYTGAYAIVEARHERQMNRALFEQNRFMTLAASDSPGGLNEALAECIISVSYSSYICCQFVT
ncbi:MAG: hypothetical protein ETSY1_34650 [Candidatus Entotheonella factor]|uniref:Uncharacterized protein n=1 Tax=Entotheonella factor TaxID=1429438 RepID=W4L8Y0_ENTF1|nr:hypothetical protein [Candidatus Entotheonella palauensis]ETW94487.1 MAG: hypothetical protein ETSY1_34650 [Candidatus Entotheonella factor]